MSWLRSQKKLTLGTYVFHQIKKAFILVLTFNVIIDKKFREIEFLEFCPNTNIMSRGGKTKNSWNTRIGIWSNKKKPSPNFSSSYQLWHVVCVDNQFENRCLIEKNGKFFFVKLIADFTRLFFVVALHKSFGNKKIVKYRNDPVSRFFKIRQGILPSCLLLSLLWKNAKSFFQRSIL